MTAVPQPSRAVALLMSRKEALETMIRERFRQARQHHKPANVTMLSAALRALKRQIASLDRRAGLVTHEGQS